MQQSGGKKRQFSNFSLNLPRKETKIMINAKKNKKKKTARQGVLKMTAKDYTEGAQLCV